MENAAKGGAGSRKLRRKLLLAAAAVVLCLFSAEAAIRISVCVRAGCLAPLFGAVVRSDNTERADPVLNHVLVPGMSFTQTGTPPGAEYCVYSRINSLGMHDGEPAPASDTNRVRVLVLGDSFAEARQVPIAENFCGLLEKRLRAERGDGIEVLNAGVPSYSPILEYLSWHTRFREFRPRVVLLVFFANDVFDDLRYSAVASFDGDGVPVAVPSDRVPWMRLLGDDDAGRSMAYRAELSRIVHSRPRGLARISYLAAWTRRAMEMDALRRKFPAPPKNEEFFILEDDPALRGHRERGWALTAKYLGLLKQECDEDGAKLLLAAVPIAAQVCGGSSYDHFFFSGVPNTNDQERVRRIAGELGVEFVDLMRPLKAGGAAMYFPGDGHWTRAGHRVAADALYPAVSAAAD